jgi:hypothetical protein
MSFTYAHYAGKAVLNGILGLEKIRILQQSIKGVLSILNVIGQYVNPYF